MFCLRSWIPILFFLTNASPIYLVLFISATYVLNRPCVYCSLLLCILVISLFDFHSNWFEPRYSSSLSPATSLTADGTVGSAALLSASTTGAAMLQIVSGVAKSAMKNVVSNLGIGGGRSMMKGNGTTEMAGLVGGFSGLLRREWRVNCLDVVIRL